MRSLVHSTITDLELHTSNSASEFTVLVAIQTILIYPIPKKDLFFLVPKKFTRCFKLVLIYCPFNWYVYILTNASYLTAVFVRWNSPLSERFGGNYQQVFTVALTNALVLEQTLWNEVLFMFHCNMSPFWHQTKNERPQ